MITNGGGSGLLSCDHFDRCGLPLKELKEISAESGRAYPRAYMPMFGSPLNPVDISGTASPTQYKGAFMQAMRDPAVDGILGSICPTAVTNVDAVVDVVIEVHDRYRRLGKPFIMECQGGEECPAGDHEAARSRYPGVSDGGTGGQCDGGVISLWSDAEKINEKRVKRKV